MVPALVWKTSELPSMVLETMMTPKIHMKTVWPGSVVPVELGGCQLVNEAKRLLTMKFGSGAVSHC